MAPPKATEDYYLILEIAQTDTLETITASWKRLILQRHPDKNLGKNTTEDFQLLKQAYDTLKDPLTGREYDLLYTKLRKFKPDSSFPHTRNSPRNQTSSRDYEAESYQAIQIAALQKVKQDRAAGMTEWRTIIKNQTFELRRTLNQLRVAIERFEEIERAERAEKDAANSWSTWILSPVYKKALETPEEKERKANERLERLHAKNIKETASVSTRAKLVECETRLREREEQLRDENNKDDAKIFIFRQSLRRKLEKEQAEKERVKRESTERFWREQQEKQNAEKEAKEKIRKAQEENDRAEREARERARREQQEKERIEREREEKAQMARKAAEKKARDKKEREIVSKAREDQIDRMREEDELNGIVRESYEKLVAKEPARDHLGHILYFPTYGTGNITQPFAPTSQECSHAEWWPKVHKSGTCEKCYVFRHNYLCNVLAAIQKHVHNARPSFDHEEDATRIETQSKIGTIQQGLRQTLITTIMLIMIRAISFYSGS